MSVSDLDFASSAHRRMQLHGDAALAEAHKMVETMRKKGDKDGADYWLRIIAANHHPRAVDLRAALKGDCQNLMTKPMAATAFVQKHNMRKHHVEKRGAAEEAQPETGAGCIK
jgi:hypothetical protein